MIKFAKKFFVFSNKSQHKDLISDEEINSITDEQAIEFLNKLPIQSLLDLNRKENEIYLLKGLFSSIDGFIACIGKPGQGKSSLCSAFYKVYFGLENEIFSISNSTLSFTKGLWILKEKERQKIKQNIIKDIIDVEGFQVDDLSTWKYIMIVAFISTDIIIVNRSDRLDDVKKILSIIWNSLDKMKKLGLPKLLKNIWIQIEDEEKLKDFEILMESIGNPSKKWDEKGIKLKSIFIEDVPRRDLKKANNNILKVDFYLEQVKNVFDEILKIKEFESVSGLQCHIDNFNNTMNGKDSFNMDNIKDELKNDFETCYSIIKTRTEKKLQHDYQIEKFKEPINLDESFEDFINRQNIDFSFKKDDVINQLSFYKSSENFDKIYDELIEQKDYKADPSIFKHIYDSLIEKIKVKIDLEIKAKQLEKEKLIQEERIKKQRELQQIYEKKENARIEHEKIKIKIKSYFSELKFYDYIESYSSSKYDLKGDYGDQNKNEYNHKLRDFYNEQKKIKRKEWEDQITRAKYRQTVQSYGEMKCKNGHEYSDANVGCGKCKKKGIDFNNRLLYWVDGDANYVICRHCNEVFDIDEDLVCGSCGAPSLCKVKWNRGYRP